MKVGIGPGSICTTRVIQRRGRAADHGHLSKPPGREAAGVPIIADGGIRYSGDITKAIAAGAHAVMIGGLFAGLAESPGKTDFVSRTHIQSVSRNGSPRCDGERIERTISPTGGTRTKHQAKLVPEGVEGRVPFKGPLEQLRVSARRRVESRHGLLAEHETIEELRKEARFIQVSHASVRESHPHDIAITQEAPNYSTEFTGELD